jgi:hypothetical protein
MKTFDVILSLAFFVPSCALLGGWRSGAGSAASSTSCSAGSEALARLHQRNSPKASGNPFNGWHPTETLYASPPSPVE